MSLQLCLLAGSGLLLALGLALWRTGGVGVSPLSARVRGLFLKHTRTGNPLVDSVAEHQPANEQAYEQYLGKDLYKLAPYGLLLCGVPRCSFLLVP